jgi:hypothetical protein
LLAHVLEREIELVPHLLVRRGTDADPTRLGQRLQSGRDVNAITEDVVLFGNDIAQVHADAKTDAPLFGHLGLPISHPALDLDGAAHRVHNTRKFRQQAVAGILYGMATMVLDLWLNYLAEMCPEAFVSPFLVRPHQARISRHIGGEDRGKTADRGHDLPGGKVRSAKYTRNRRWP